MRSDIGVGTGRKITFWLALNVDQLLMTTLRRPGIFSLRAFAHYNVTDFTREFNWAAWAVAAAFCPLTQDSMFTFDKFNCFKLRALRGKTSLFTILILEVGESHNLPKWSCSLLN